MKQNNVEKYETTLASRGKNCSGTLFLKGHIKPSKNIIIIAISFFICTSDKLSVSCRVSLVPRE